MRLIEIPFALGDVVRTTDGYEFVIAQRRFFCEEWTFASSINSWYKADAINIWHKAKELTLVGPVLEWKERPASEGTWHFPHPYSVSGRWSACDSGYLYLEGLLIGYFDNPKAVAEEIQTIINERSKSE